MLAMYALFEAVRVQRWKVDVGQVTTIYTIVCHLPSIHHTHIPPTLFTGRWGGCLPTHVALSPRLFFLFCPTGCEG